jgi:hypothetical protein
MALYPPVARKNKYLSKGNYGKEGINPVFRKPDGFAKCQKKPSPLTGEGWGEGE